MNSHYFSQHLLNKGILPITRVKQLLKDSSDLKPGLRLLAVKQGIVTPDQIGQLGGQSDDKFIAAAKEQGLLTETQISNLSQAITGESLSFAQAMLNDDMPLGDVGKYLQDYDEYKSLPVREAVSKLIGPELESEQPMYEEFSDVFMDSFVRFIGTPAVINIDEPYHFDTAAASHIVSQVLVGVVNLVTGFYATDEVFIDIASRYSRERFTEMNDMVLDSVMEFFNVLNGLYAVEIAKRELEADLEIPTVAANAEPMGNQQLIVPIETGCGSFALIMATDEFIFA